MSSQEELKPLPLAVKKQIETIDRIIDFNKKMLERIEREPYALSSEGGVLVHIKTLRGRHEKALKDWQQERRKILREWRKRGYGLVE